VRSNGGAGGVEVVYQALAVEAHSNGLADIHIVKGGESIGHGEVEDVHCFAVFQYEGVITTDNFEVIGAGVVDTINGAGLKFEQAGSTFGAPAEDEGISLGCVAPVVFVLLEDNAVAAVPGIQHIRAGTNTLLEDFTGKYLLFYFLLLDLRQGRKRSNFDQVDSSSVN